MDTIDWKSLGVCDGDASQVPGLLLDHLSPAREVRSKARLDLFWKIWHQGTIYEATSYTVPFLIEIASTEATPDRFEVISTLGVLADGSSFLDVHGNLLKKPTEELERALQTELEWVERTRNAVKAGDSLYLRDLGAPNQKLSCACAYVLSRFPGEQRYWTAITARFEQAVTDEAIKCGLANLMQPFASTGACEPEWLAGALRAESSLAARIQLAAALERSKSGSPAAARELLLENLLCNEKLEPLFRQQPWDIGEPIQYVIEALCTSRAGRLALVGRFNELLAAGTDRGSLNYCKYVMKMRLGDRLDTGINDRTLRPLTLREN